ncbi:hypothetical protein ACWEXZ_13640 [Staphylococcus xylosus]|uniref:hypothetical protein n=1 Tax=Staphylococcus TaxID=1279 RepID=UPI00115E2F95|nr:hypothetical protein [Staphylococcus xylosus]
MNTVEMAQLLKYYGFRGFLKAINKRSFIVAVLPEDKAHNRKVLNKLKGVMASESRRRNGN